MLGAFVVAALLAYGCPAAADDAQGAAVAEQLFRDGRALLAEGKLREACEKFAESRRLDPEPGTLLNLARCYEDVGRTASAWAAYRELETSASKRGQTKRAEFARERVAALEPSLPTLVITVPERHRVEGLAVRYDGLTLGSAAWESRVPVDPGVHEVAASAPGRHPWQREVSVRSGEAAPVEVPLLALVPAAPLHREPAPATDRSTWKTVGIATTIGGGAAIAASLAFGGAAMAQNDDARKSECAADGCTREGLDRIGQADDLATVSTVLMIGGAALVAIGLPTWLVFGRTAASSSGWRLRW